MIAVALEEVVRVYCDVCGKDITRANRTGIYGKDFCMGTLHTVLGRSVSCDKFYRIKMQIASADIDS